MHYNKRNKLAFFTSIISGLLLILSGTTGVASWIKIEEIVLMFTNITLVKIIFTTLIIIASLGGFAVIIGGLIILKNKVRIGRFIISLGAGAGIITLLINLFLAVSTKEFTIVWFLSYATIGIILSVITRKISKPEK